MEQYAISSRSYLFRAEQCLKTGRLADLHYAALELRCGVEARLREHLEPHEFISVGKKSDWRVGNLHRTAAESFKLGDRVARIVIGDAENQQLATLYYTPVSERLKEISERLGSYLHAAKRCHGPEAVYWSDLRAQIEEGIRLLKQSTFGKLLVPLLMTRNGPSTMPVEFLPDANGISENALRNLKGKRFTLDVAYFDSLDDALRDRA